MSKIKNSLSSIWAFLAFPADAEEHEFTDADLDKVNNELATRETTITNLTTERDDLTNSIANKDQEIADLKNQVETLKRKPGAQTNPTNNQTDGNTDNSSIMNVINGANEMMTFIENLQS